MDAITPFQFLSGIFPDPLGHGQLMVWSKIRRSGKTLTLHEGERLGSWRLDQILDDRAVLIADGRRETLMVYDFSKPAAAAMRARAANRRPPRQTRQQPAPPARRVRPQQPEQR